MQVQMPDLVDMLWFARKEAGLRYPKAAASRLAQKGELIRLKQGLYLRSGLEHNTYALGSAANRLYGPSYISFVWALRFYGLIPEDVPHVTSATFAKGRSKRFDTAAGGFFYHDVPSAAYPLSLTFLGDGEQQFLVASPEKALCDELYLKPQVRALKEIPALLFEDMRLDEERVFALDRALLCSLAPVYRNTTLHTLIRFLEKEKT
jgi:hypothetical protein